MATGGDGIYIVHSDGSRTLDGCSGAAVSCLGHSHQKVIDAIVHQAQQLSFAHTSVFTSQPAEDLASLLVESSDGAFSNVMFLSSGSEAVESAIKLVRQYHICNGEPERVNFISRKYGYHGNTIGALSAGYNPPRRQPFEPLLSDAFHHVSPCFFTRDGREDETEAQYVDRLVQEYEEMFQRLGPKTVAAVMLETISGATLGAVPPAVGYLARLRALCNKHGALLLFDEVMCGMGRAGTLHAWQSLGGVAPDLQTIGKGLGGGYQPISAILVAARVHTKIAAAQAQHPFVSGHTYQGHAIGCAAALATQRAIIDDKLLKRVVDMGDLLEDEVRRQVPHLKEVRGLGLFKAAEFAPVASRGHIAPDVVKACLTNGLAVYLCSPATDAVLFAPPFIITPEQIKELVRIFAMSVKQVLERKVD
ncbi:pyridoxal phosphate-dependent transferase [Microdochium trichocladiopsis]|uniref:Pyridoxal phosphate-dependent transferase n=1 Tax=Microdochium trichocladiopsis TaxID=1682393 RepID=A0A9P9BKY3_9PEZI|nr:pyridoxal phosphate-dependent transferase [Microdochium trichocladiopsis]KAH7024339.1 pyridoxal phosphate-dependent transferase [Microdochium trichocladiopsis]